MIENDLKTIKVVFADGSSKDVPDGISLIELSKDYENEFKSTIIAAKVNNDIKELNFHLFENCKLEFIDLTNEDGIRIYKRSLYFILIKAVHDIYPDRKVVINHSISKGLYCEIKGDTELTEEEVVKIQT